ncbi:Putative transcriptional regulatory protein [Psilocybe cubensis]|uniref:Transcriptional regulatory protein n=1 Tax=Psilocybe cubensis TaxID=181762 RepID=A0ACB8GVS3_PSICU|nr:Putative transcriptional regulatory protein [Psilocybe cubensis]KAH9479075.1 Putative transcriptional regulatory protein [Psilocybe cubensis]
MAAKQAATMRSLVTGQPDTGLDPKHYMRSQFWSMNPWEHAYITSSESTYVYPEPDLLLELVTVYFEKTNALIPIVHEPSFMKGLLSGKHHVDPSFGQIVLLVCANGARYSTDPRACYAPESQHSSMSNGWQFFRQVPLHRRQMFYTTTVYDLQYYAVSNPLIRVDLKLMMIQLAAIFVNGSALCSVSSNIVGIGLRYAIEIGAHRRNGQTQPSFENEHSKRAFWVLFCLDALLNSFYGRPAGISHDSFDLEYPVECDDEYWDHEDPQKRFRQPPGKPCSMSNFIHLIKLCEILSFSSRTLYSTKKSKLVSGYFGEDWEMRMVAELDSSLNKWRAALPSHLQWDPLREDEKFFQQSANLNSIFFYVQIQAHRPFLIKKSKLSLTSVIMCTNAARSCSGIQEAAMARDCRVLPHTTYIAFTAGIVSVLCLWSSRCPGYVGDPQKESENLLRCVSVLKKCEKLWHSAGSFRDVLCEAGALDRSEIDGPSPENSSGTIQLPDPFKTIFSPPLQDDATWSNNWDYTGLFLAEMGHRELQSSEINHPQLAPSGLGLPNNSDPSVSNTPIEWSSNTAGYPGYPRYEGWEQYARHV